MNSLPGSGFWIIPARAGFTEQHSELHARAADHPRSRGVYDIETLPHPGLEGSSPLARGLRNAETFKSVGMGIIPARAGFTVRSWRYSSPRSDHPRSRGVYSFLVASVTSRSGSSPLARGLRRWMCPVGRSSRIIPARAGFTIWGSPWAVTPPDHPRSRGVYAERDEVPARRPGSSPLARGLLLHDDSFGAVGRIIPARAGFTGPGSPLGPAGPDHPRSRGVYFRKVQEGEPVIGSSPLARGLRRSPQ